MIILESVGNCRQEEMGCNLSRLVLACDGPI